MSGISALSFGFRLEFPHVMVINVAGKGRPFLLTYIVYFIIWSSIGCIGGLQVAVVDVWHPPPTGFATITHYTLPLDYITSCGCTPKSTHYPTAALSALAFGSTQAYGPGCGACYKLTPLNTFLSTPPWYPPQSDIQSIVIKVTDLCPTWSSWCEATASQPNRAGNYLNFDLAFPSISIPDNFFPSNTTYYGYSDFGVWNGTYEATSCSNWSGWNDPAALGSVTNLGDSVCCPADTSNVTCPSFSEQHGDPVPPTGSQGAAVAPRPRIVYTLIVSAALLAMQSWTS